MRQNHCMTCKMAKNIENGGNEKCTLQDLNMARKLKIIDIKNTYCRKLNMAKTLKNVKNEKRALQDLEYDDKTEKHRKEHKNTVGP